MKKLKSLFLSLLSLLIMTSQVYAKSNMNLIDSTKEYILDNGLKVLIKEDHTAPIYTQALFYKVGSRNDISGQTGIAHYLEHMQFNGTKTRAKGSISEDIESRGGTFNAATSTDFTMYYMTLPEGNLDFSLALEADRMRNSILNTEEAEREKRVVLAELSGGENSPMTLLFRDVLKTAYPEQPYGRPIIGWEEDVKGITAENLRQYYDTYYQPNNAVLILVGDLKPEETLNKIKETLGKIPASNSPIPQIKISPNKPKQNLVEVKSPSESSIITFAWNAVSFKDKDYVPLSVLSAILTNGSLSRLEKALVDTGKTSYVGSSMRQGIDPFSFYILAVTSKDGNLDEIQKIIQAEITKIQKNGISEDELKRVKAKAATAFLFGLEDSAGMASQLGFFELVGGDWKKTFAWSEEIEAVTSAQILEVANKYLKTDNLVIGKLTNSSTGLAPIGNIKAGSPEIAHYKTPQAELSSTTAKGIKTETIILDNGLKVILRQNPNNPVITVSGNIDAGEVFDKDLIGVSTLTGLMLERGNAKYKRDEFNIALENLGAEIEISPEKDFVSVNAKARSQDYEQLLKLLALSLINPTFDQEELNKLKTQILLDLQQSQDDLSALGKIAIYEALFPKNHPYYEPDLKAQMQSVQKLTKADLSHFHQEFYSPERTILSISGDFEKKEILAALNKYFANWSSKAKSNQFQVSQTPISEPKQIKTIEVAGKSQALIIMGHNGEVNRSHPDFYALLTANDILGGGSTLSSRLGTKVREEAGLVYTIRSSMSMGRAAGPFLIQMGVAPDKIDKAIELTKAELKRFCEGNITDQELERAKNYRMGYFISNNLTSNENIAFSLSQYALWGLDLNTINEYPNIIKKLTKADIIRVSQKYLAPEKLQIVVLKPKSK